MKRRTFIKSIAGIFAATQIPNVAARPQTKLPDNSTVFGYESVDLSEAKFDVFVSDMTASDYKEKQKELNIIRRQMLDNLYLTNYGPKVK